MKYGKVARLGLFRSINAKTSSEQVLSIDELTENYFRPNGSNVYIGFTQLCQRVSGGGMVLLPSHTQPMLALAEAALAGETAYVCINIKPNLPDTNSAGQFAFLLADENKSAYSALAEALSSLDVVQSGKLKPVVRFAGEMNAGNVYSGQPELFKQCLPRLHSAFSSNNISLSFCPAINSGVASLQSILNYLPNNHNIFDYASCTLYIRPENNRVKVMNLYKEYVNHFGPGKRLVIDELGGCNTNSTGNDAMLKKMLQAIPQPVEYATLFLSKGPSTHWGEDATLEFLTNPAPAPI